MCVCGDLGCLIKFVYILEGNISLFAIQEIKIESDEGVTYKSSKTILAGTCIGLCRGIWSQISYHYPLNIITPFILKCKTLPVLSDYKDLIYLSFVLQVYCISSKQ